MKPAPSAEKIKMVRCVSQGHIAQPLNRLVEERVLTGFQPNFASRVTEHWAPGVIVTVEYDMQISEAVKFSEEALRPLGTVSVAADVCRRSQSRG
jgi:hypothetical protein